MYIRFDFYVADIRISIGCLLLYLLELKRVFENYLIHWVGLRI